MADIEGGAPSKDFFVDVPPRREAFFLKGSNSLDWGMQNRLARIFNPVSGRTVMLAIDHGYFQGPTTGLERVDLTIVPLLPPRRPRYVAGAPRRAINSLIRAAARATAGSGSTL